MAEQNHKSPSDWDRKNHKIDRQRLEQQRNRANVQPNPRVQQQRQAQEKRWDDRRRETNRQQHHRRDH